jgi:hypothetical protein
MLRMGLCQEPGALRLGADVVWLVQIDLPGSVRGHGIRHARACFGIVLHRRTVTFAAPIGRWMLGKDWDTVRDWVRGRGGTFRFVTARNHEGDPFRRLMLNALIAREAEVYGAEAP